MCVFYYRILPLGVSLCRTLRMSEKGSTSDMKNAMEGDGKRTRDQVGLENNALLSDTILHAFHDIQCNVMQS